MLEMQGTSHLAMAPSLQKRGEICGMLRHLDRANVVDSSLQFSAIYLGSYGTKGQGTNHL